MHPRTRRRISWITLAFLVVAVARLIAHVTGWLT